MGEMPKVGQVWCRPYLWGLFGMTRIVACVDEKWERVIYNVPLGGYHQTSLRDWNRWSRKATLVKEADNGD